MGGPSYKYEVGEVRKMLSNAVKQMTKRHGNEEVTIDDHMAPRSGQSSQPVFDADDRNAGFLPNSHEMRCSRARLGGYESDRSFCRKCHPVTQLNVYYVPPLQGASILQY